MEFSVGHNIDHLYVGLLQLFASMDHGRSVGMIQLALGGCDPEDSTHDESKRSFVGPHSDGFAW